LADKGSRQVNLASDDSGRIAALWTRQRRTGQLIQAANPRVEQRAAVLSAPTAWFPRPPETAPRQPGADP